MYELGYAIAAERYVVIISAPTPAPMPEKYPFDIQHRGIVSYEAGSLSDFSTLGATITKKLLAYVQLQEKTSIVATSPLRSSHGLQPHEFTALALLLAGTDSMNESISASWLKQEMRKARYTDIGLRLAMVKLGKLGYVWSESKSDYHDDFYVVFGLTEAGETWLLENQDKLSIGGKIPDYEDTSTTDDDIPF